MVKNHSILLYCSKHAFVKLVYHLVLDLYFIAAGLKLLRDLEEFICLLSGLISKQHRLVG